ncbi:MAG TPA: hypothetical protein VGU25_02140 [Acidobacteriaceae bacterium]|nr:hypothetical protein [Acidobacteriaceae bacterium]
MHSIQIALLSGAIAVSILPASAQNAAASSATPTAPAIADTWNHLTALPAHAHIHVAADHGGATCYFISADDQNLTCGHKDGADKARHVFPRADVKSVKLTRYGISTLGGAAIGGGVGAIIGVGTSHPGGFIDLTGAYRAACAVVGGIGGAAVGGPTDMFRGPTVYRRVETK